MMELWGLTRSEGAASVVKSLIMDTAGAEVAAYDAATKESTLIWVVLFLCFLVGCGRAAIAVRARQLLSVQPSLLTWSSDWL